MVAAFAANQTPDVRPAFGSLLLAPREIEHPRWRLDAYARIGPALHRCGVPLDRLRGSLREGMRGAVCPAPLRAGLEQLVLDHVERDRIGALAIRALWTRDWPTAALHAAAAYIAARDWRMAGRLAVGRGESFALTVLAREGCVDGDFVGDLRDAELYEATVPLVAALVEARDLRAEAIAARVKAKDREPAQAHVARIRGNARGLATPRGRSGAWLWIARDLLAADRFDTARTIGERIEMPMVRQYARLELARALVERGRISDGLVELRLVKDVRLAVERRAVIDEIRLVSTREDFVCGWRVVVPRETWQPAMWMLPTRALAPITRRALVRTAGILRVAHRHDDRFLLADAASELHTIAYSSRAFLDLAHRAGIDVDRALFAAARFHAGVDPVIAERIAMRAEQANDVPPLVTTSDPTSIERAMFDEHVALTQPARRRVLIAVSQHSLRDALVHPVRWPALTVAARLRTLVHLGGELGRDALAKALRTLPFHREITPTALEALALLDGQLAATFVLDRLQQLPDPFRVLRLVEVHRGLPAGFTRALSKLENRYITREWILELVTTWRARTGDVPSLEMLRRLGITGTKPQPIAELVDRIQQAPVTLRKSDDHVTIVKELVAKPELLEDLAMCEPARVDVTMRPWREHRMRELVKRASSKPVGEIVPSLVARVARRLRPATLEPIQTFAVAGVRYRVRYLDKRLDLLTYLRFADVPARSCFRSNQGWYFRCSRDETLAAWKDPLTVCFHVERERGGELQVCGFLFGNFADVGGKLGLVFNSLHVRPRSAGVREQVLRAVERMVAPFGITQLGIANVHGGHGPLPDDYVLRDVEVVRYRALAICGQLVEDVWDDLPWLNQRMTVRNLYWRTLQTPDAAPAGPSAS
jgi:hypothetical protein